MPLAGEVICSLRRLDRARGRRAGRPGDGRGRGDPGRPAGRGREPPGGTTGSTSPAGTARRSAGPSPPTPAGSGCSATATPGPSCSGSSAVLGTGQVVSHLRRAPQGQHRLPPARAAVRQRGDARRRDGGAAAPGAAEPRAGGGAPRLRGRRRRPSRPRRAAPGARLAVGGRAVLRGRDDAGADGTLGLRRPLRPAPRRLPARRGGRRASTRPPALADGGRVAAGRRRRGRSATDRGAGRELWRYREAHTEAINRPGRPAQARHRRPARRARRVRRAGARRSSPALRPAPRCGCSATPATATSM